MNRKLASPESKTTITRWGTLAYSCATSEAKGKVLAAVSKALYLLTDTGELFWITTEAAPLHRRGATVSTSLPDLKVGSPFHFEDERLVTEAFVFDFRDTVVWNPSRMGEPGMETSKLEARTRAFTSVLDLSEARGFGKFLPHILSLSPDSLSSPLLESSDPILRFAQPIVLGMARACLEGDTSDLTQNAEALIGLGSGLTPSGDDFVGGLLFAWNALQAVYPERGSIRATLPIETYSSRTHLISFTLLKDLADGHAIAPLHNIARGLLEGKPSENILPFIAQLTEVGHSTGWDLLAGFLTGILSTG
jgi:hypothetical protein